MLTLFKNKPALPLITDASTPTDTRPSVSSSELRSRLAQSVVDLTRLNAELATASLDGDNANVRERESAIAALHQERATLTAAIADAERAERDHAERERQREEAVTRERKRRQLAADLRDLYQQWSLALADRAKVMELRAAYVRAKQNHDATFAPRVPALDRIRAEMMDAGVDLDTRVYGLAQEMNVDALTRAADRYRELAERVTLDDVRGARLDRVTLPPAPVTPAQKDAERVESERYQELMHLRSEQDRLYKEMRRLEGIGDAAGHEATRIAWVDVKSRIIELVPTQQPTVYAGTLVS